MPDRARSAHRPADAGTPVRTPWGETAVNGLDSSCTGGAFSVVSLELPLGWQRPRYVHHGADECFAVQAGQVRFELEDRDQPVLAGPGDVVYVPRGVARSLALATPEPATVLVVQSPGGDGRPGDPGPATLWLDGIEVL